MKLTTSLIMATAMITTSAMAQTNTIAVTQPITESVNTLELNRVFDTTQLNQIQALELSKQEMKETEGAVLNFAIGAGFGFGGYALSNGINAYTAAGCFACQNFTASYQDSWSWRDASFNTGVGALTGGLGGAALRGTGITQNWGKMTFANEGLIKNTAKNMQRTWTNPIGISIKVTAMGAGTGVKQTYNYFNR